DDIAVAPGITTRTCNDYTSTFNVVTAAANCFVQRIPPWVDSVERETGGTRPVWEILQLFQRGAHLAMTYPVLYQMGLSALISERNWGNMGGIGWWGWVSSSGMEQAWFGAHNTQALADFYLMASQINELAPVLMTTPSDSPILNGGTGQVDGASGETVTGGQVLSNVKVSGSTVSADCGAASTYTNATNFPFGEVRFFTVKFPVGSTGLVDQYIFAENLCHSTPTVQFTVANVPAGATQVEVLNAGRTIALSGNTFTDTWNDAPTGTAGFGVYVYVIRAPRGTVIGAASNLTGVPHSEWLHGDSQVAASVIEGVELGDEIPTGFLGKQPFRGPENALNLNWLKPAAFEDSVHIVHGPMRDVRVIGEHPARAPGVRSREEE